MKKYTKYSAQYSARILAVLFGVLAIGAAVPALAETPASSVTAQVTTQPGMRTGMNRGQGRGMMNGIRSGIFGSVTTVSGSTLTVASKGFGKDTATTTYQVDASGATVMKNNATSTLSSVLTGDFVAVQGKVTGTTVAASMIRDGMMMRGKGPGNGGKPGTMTPPITGNGQPVIAGTLSAINGSTLTLTTKTNVTYSIDASTAKISLGSKAGTITDVKVNDSVIVQGTINGTNVVAASIIDGPQSQPGNNSGTAGENKPKAGGLFGGIGQFFMHLFGF